jgi:site-specific DNA-methyltransferase (adenine-specific)
MVQTNIVHLCDCLDFMKTCKDNQFDLSICDPPYGIGADVRSDLGKKRGQTAAANSKDYGHHKWDSKTPDDIYFKELIRISKNQIIWGVNYYSYYLGSGRIFWDKNIPDNYTKSDGELAYKSFGTAIDYIKIIWNGMIQHDMKNKEIRIHPTQKPVALYHWLLKNYAKKGDKIFDSHVGSGSSRIACYELGFDFEGTELDLDYFNAQEERFELEKARIDDKFYLPCSEKNLFTEIV